MIKKNELFRASGESDTDKILILLAGVILPLVLYILRREILGDPMVDFGSELFLASSLLKGSRLYIDHYYYFGPLGPYLNAAGLALLGNSWSSLITFHLFIYLFLLIAIYGILRKFVSMRSAAFFLAFISLFFGFNHTSGVGNYNFLTPYRSVLPYSLTAAAFSLWFLLEGKRSFLLAAGFFASLCFLGKAEVFFALAGSFGFISLFSKQELSNLPYVALGFLAGLVITAAILAIWGLPPGDLWIGVVESYLLPFRSGIVNQVFYQNTFGLETVLRSPFFLMGILFILIFWVVPLQVLRRFSGNRIICFSLCAILALTLNILAMADIRYAHWFGFWIYLTPTVCLLSLLTASVRRMKEPGSHWREVQLLAAFSFLLSLKVLFKADNDHYGFVLALPCSLFTIFLFWEAFPKLLWPGKEYGAARWSWKIYFSLSLLPLLVYVFFVSERQMKRRVVEFHWPSAHFFYFANSVPLLALESYIREAHPGARTMQTIPDGSFLNYVLDKRQALPHASLLPDQVLVYGSESIIAHLKESPPDIGVYIPRRIIEDLGVGSFETGYGSEIQNWISQNSVKDPNFPPGLRKIGFELVLSREYAKKIGVSVSEAP